jgi:hypothetical protein
MCEDKTKALKMKVVFCAYPYIKDNQKIWTSTRAAFLKGNCQMYSNLLHKLLHLN